MLLVIIVVCAIVRGYIFLFRIFARRLLTLLGDGTPGCRIETFRNLSDATRSGRQVRHRRPVFEYASGGSRRRSRRFIHPRSVPVSGSAFTVGTPTFLGTVARGTFTCFTTSWRRPAPTGCSNSTVWTRTAVGTGTWRPATTATTTTGRTGGGRAASRTRETSTSCWRA